MDITPAPAAKRILACVIDGETYYMNYSVLAYKEIGIQAAAEKQTVNEYLKSQTDDALERTMETAALLIREGARYKKMREGVEVKTITANELMLVCGPGDIDYLSDLTALAIAIGQQREIVAEPPKNSKNGETARS